MDTEPAEERLSDGGIWQGDGLKGYLTNTDIPASQVYAAYHNLWHVERAFRISKSKIEIRPMFHFTRHRIEAHVCICFVVLKVYKELDRLLKLANINMSVDKVLALAQTIVTIQLTLPQNKQIISRTNGKTKRTHHPSMPSSPFYQAASPDNGRAVSSLKSVEWIRFFRLHGHRPDFPVPHLLTDAPMIRKW